jgi:hypothetical protein
MSVDAWTGDKTTPVLSYNFSENNADLVLYETTNNNDGVITGATWVDGRVA